MKWYGLKVSPWIVSMTNRDWWGSSELVVVA